MFIFCFSLSLTLPLSRFCPSLSVHFSSVLPFSFLLFSSVPLLIFRDALHYVAEVQRKKVFPLLLISGRLLFPISYRLRRFFMPIFFFIHIRLRHYFSFTAKWLFIKYQQARVPLLHFYRHLIKNIILLSLYSIVIAIINARKMPLAISSRLCIFIYRHFINARFPLLPLLCLYYCIF